MDFKRNPKLALLWLASTNQDLITSHAWGFVPNGKPRDRDGVNSQWAGLHPDWVPVVSEAAAPSCAEEMPAAVTTSSTPTAPTALSSTTTTKTVTVMRASTISKELEPEPSSTRPATRFSVSTGLLLTSLVPLGPPSTPKYIFSLDTAISPSVLPQESSTGGSAEEVKESASLLTTETTSTESLTETSTVSLTSPSIIDISTPDSGSDYALLPTGTLPVSETTSLTESVSTLQTAFTSAAPASGIIPSSLETGGRTSIVPFRTTDIVTPSSSLTPKSTSLSPSSATPTIQQSGNVFAPIGTDAPPANIQRDWNHPAPRLGIENITHPLETNKFYANFFLGGQSRSTWTHPYSLRWIKGSGTSQSGLGISHTERRQLSYDSGNPAKNFISPLGIDSIILTAEELGQSTVLTTDSLGGFSVNVNLRPAAGDDTLIQFPLVQGMGFVTGIYAGGTPLLQSGVFFSIVHYVGPVRYGDNTYKYRIELVDGTNWLLYVTPKGIAGTPPFELLNSGNIQGPSSFFGLIQVCKNNANMTGEWAYDASAGSYARSGSVSASVSGNIGTYTLSWDKGGVQTNKLLMFALPHHLESMDASISTAVTDLELSTTTKGIAKALLADSITMTEQLATGLDFAPYHPTYGSIQTISAIAKSKIQAVAAEELSQNMERQTNLDSMYFSGKARLATPPIHLQELH